MNPPEVRVETTAWGECKALWTLAWPVVLGMVGHMSMGLVDVAMVGRLGEDVLASTALGNLWGFAVVMLFRSVLHGLDPLVAQCYGAGERRETGLFLVRGVLLALLLAIPTMILHRVAFQGLSFLGQPEELLPVASAYCKALTWGVPFMFVFYAMRSFLQGLGVVRPVAVAYVLCNLLNAGLNYLFIYGKWGFPAMGAVGCAWSSAFCQLALILVLVWICRDLFREWLPDFEGVMDKAAFRKLLVIGLPIAAHISLEVWAFQMASVMMGWLGALPIAANTVALSLAAFSFMFPLGICIAATTRVGNLIGAGERWQKSAWVAILLGAGVMACFSLLFWLIPRPLARIFVQDVAVLELAVVLIPLAGAFQIFDGIQAVAVGVMRGAGDVKVPPVASTVAFWFFGLPLGGWWALERGLGPVGIWYGLVVGLGFLALVLSLRLVWLGRQEIERV